MISNPKPGQVVQVWYRVADQPTRPLHGKTGIIEVAARGHGPRNHAVRVDGVLHSIPAGQLRAPQQRMDNNLLW